MDLQYCFRTVSSYTRFFFSFLLLCFSSGWLASYSGSVGGCCINNYLYFFFVEILFFSPPCSGEAFCTSLFFLISEPQKNEEILFFASCPFYLFLSFSKVTGRLRFILLVLLRNINFFPVFPPPFFFFIYFPFFGETFSFCHLLKKLSIFFKSCYVHL